MNAREGQQVLASLIKGGNRKLNGRYLTWHPFGLKIPTTPALERRGSPILCGDPCGSISSLMNMTTGIARQIALREGLFECGGVYLRVISVRVAPVALRHNYFFECGLGMLVFICGGCTDYSAGGRRALQQMLKLFRYLGYTYKVESIGVNIGYEIGLRHLHALGAITTHNEEIFI